MATINPSPTPVPTPTTVKAVTPAPAAPAPRIFFGELPAAVSYMTEKGTPVFFYQGYHVTSRQDIAEFCLTLAGVSEVTDNMKLEEVPVPTQRDRGRGWQSASRTEITPAELLQRIAIASSKQLPTAAPSNS